MDLRKVGRGAVLILLLLVSALPAGARVEGTVRGVERGGWERIWAAVMEWVAKLGSDMDPDGAAAPGAGTGSGEGQEGDRSELGPEIDPDGGRSAAQGAGEARRTFFLTGVTIEALGCLTS